MRAWIAASNLGTRRRIFVLPLTFAQRSVYFLPIAHLPVRVPVYMRYALWSGYTLPAMRTPATARLTQDTAARANVCGKLAYRIRGEFAAYMRLGLRNKEVA